MQYIFGHQPSAARGDFRTKDEALNYLRNELPDKAAFRYLTTYNQRLVDSIIFSFDGDLLAELVVEDEEPPTDRDKREYDKTRKVYLLSEIRVFRNLTIKASDVGLTGIQFGKKVPDGVYSQITAKVEGFESFTKNPVTSPTHPANDLPQPPNRVCTTTYRILRDTELARRIKVLHNFECQICGHTILLPDGNRYAEGHHIQPLGHDGPDIIGNILCLCPNHHAECDLGAIDVVLSELRHVDGHAIDSKFVEFHNREIHKLQALK